MTELSKLMNSDDEIEKQPAALSHFLGCCLSDSSGSALRTEDIHACKAAEESEEQESRGEVHLKNISITKKSPVLYSTAILAIIGVSHGLQQRACS